MNNPDFRALCAQLLKAADYYTGWDSDEMDEAMAAVRAALAQPAPEPPPTLEEAFATLGYHYGEDAMANVRVGWDLRGNTVCGPAPEPTFTDPGPHPPLWQVMDGAYREALAIRPLPTEGYCYAAELRAIADWMAPAEPGTGLLAVVAGLDEAGCLAIRTALLAEADRAEAGE